jgi:excinuclease UvrABC nuclease subunit
LGGGLYKNVFGPFTNGSQLREALKIIRRIFPFYDDQSVKKQNQFMRRVSNRFDSETHKST